VRMDHNDLLGCTLTSALLASSKNEALTVRGIK
jgi:hypothetical protein